MKIEGKFRVMLFSILFRRNRYCCVCDGMSRCEKSLGMHVERERGGRGGERERERETLRCGVCLCQSVVCVCVCVYHVPLCQCVK